MGRVVRRLVAVPWVPYVLQFDKAGWLRASKHGWLTDGGVRVCWTVELS